MENSIRTRGVTRNGSTKSNVSTSEKGPINIDDALSRLPRKVKSIEPVDLPPDPELERLKPASSPSSSKRSETSQRNESLGKTKISSKPPSKGITVEEILRQDDELSRVSRQSETRRKHLTTAEHVGPMKQDVKNVLSRLSPSRTETSPNPSESKHEHIRSKSQNTIFPRRPNETLSRDDISSRASPTGASRVQSRFGDLLEKSRTFNPSRVAASKPPLGQIDEKHTVATDKQPTKQILLPIIRNDRRNEKKQLRSAEIIKERIDESRSSTRSKSYPNKESVDKLLRELQEEKYDFEMQKHLLEQERAEFERMQNEIVENLRQKNDELENKLQELLLREKELAENTENAAQRRKGIANDYEFRLKLKEYEARYKIVFPDDIEDCAEIIKRIAMYEKKVTFKHTARRLFIFFVIVVEFLVTDMLGIDISDFAEDQVKMIHDYDSAFDQLSEIWFGSGPGLNPQTKIMLLFTFNMFMFIAGKYAVKSFGNDYSGMVNNGKNFIKDFISVSFLSTDNTSASTGNFDLNLMLGGLKVKRAFNNADTEQKPKEQQKPKGPAYQN